MTKDKDYANIGSEVRCPNCKTLLFEFLKGKETVIEIKCRKCKTKTEFHLEGQRK